MSTEKTVGLTQIKSMQLGRRTKPARKCREREKERSKCRLPRLRNDWKIHDGVVKNGDGERTTAGNRTVMRTAGPDRMGNQEKRMWLAENYFYSMAQQWHYGTMR
jgi:hypothetical protein